MRGVMIDRSQLKNCIARSGADAGICKSADGDVVLLGIALGEDALLETLQEKRQSATCKRVKGGSR